MKLCARIISVFQALQDAVNNEKTESVNLGEIPEELASDLIKSLGMKNQQNDFAQQQRGV